MTTDNPYNEPEPINDGSDFLDVNEALKKASDWPKLREKKIEAWKSYINMTLDADLLKSRVQRARFEAELVLEALFAIAPILRAAPDMQGKSGGRKPKNNLVSGETKLQKKDMFELTDEEYLEKLQTGELNPPQNRIRTSTKNMDYIRNKHGSQNN